MASNFMSALTDSIGSFTGNIEKAVIAIHDNRITGNDVQKKDSVPSGQGTKVISTGQKALDKLKETAKVSTSITTALEKANVFERGEERIFTVQFNPSELQFSGYGGGYVQKMNFSATDKDQDIGYGDMKTRITMTAKLIFDQVDPQDAFMADKLTASPTSIAKGLTKAGKKLFGKANISVQDEVEAFMAALRNADTRSVTFAWGKMYYKGILNRISSQYTMFNVLGEPVRAVVTLTIVCADEEITKDHLGAWEEQYKKAFGGGSSSLTGAAQKVGNLFNFKL